MVKKLMRLTACLMSFVLLVGILPAQALEEIAAGAESVQQTASKEAPQAENLLELLEAQEELAAEAQPSDALKQQIIDDETVTSRFIVKYVDGSTATATLESPIKAASSVETVERSETGAASVVRTESGMTALELSQELAREAAASARQIAYVQPDYEMQVASRGEAQSLETAEFGVNQAVLSNTIVALIDTGVNTVHPALDGRLVAGYDFFNDDSLVSDPDFYYDQGHGTHLAGVIASGGARVMPLKVFEGGTAYTSDILEAIAWAEEHGAQIVNCSWGSMSYNPALYEAMESSSMLFVAAAGNLLVNLDNYPTYPAGFDLPNVLSVAAVDAGDKLLRFSNYGPNTVDIAALGEEVPGPGFEDETVGLSGTSPASALVSALCPRATW